jgi:hypothetical protein
MLFVPQNSFGWEFNNYCGSSAAQSDGYPFPNAAGALGDALTLKASADFAGATAVEVASSSEMAADTSLIMVGMASPSSSGVDRSAMIELGVDPAGGTSYTWVLPKIIINATAVAFANRHPRIALPLRIPAGSSVAVRGATVAASDVTGGIVSFQAFGRPSRPEDFPAYGLAETVGYSSSVLGTAVSCQANPNGRIFSSTWTSLGTTSFPWRAVAFSLSASSASTSFGQYFLQLGYGSSTTSVDIVVPAIHLGTGSGETHYVISPRDLVPCNIPSGAGIYARIKCDTTNPSNQGLINICAHGVG